MHTSKPDTVHIALAANATVFDGLLVAAASLARFADPAATLVFHLLDGGIADRDFDFLATTLRRLHPQSEIDRRRIDEATDFKGLPEFHGCRMIYARLLLPRLLEDLDHVLYCDTDFLWLADATKLWRQRPLTAPLLSTLDAQPLTAQFVGRWCRARGFDFDAGRYFCVGLCLFNLRIFRERGLSEQVLDFVRAHPDVPLPEQTAMNVLFGREVTLADGRWQVIPRDVPAAALKPPCVIHYAGENPWKITRASHFVSDVQLLWYDFDAALRGITRWQSLRRHYSALQILLGRAAFVLTMGNPVTRALFDRLLARLGRGRFREVLPARQRRELRQLLSRR